MSESNNSTQAVGALSPFKHKAFAILSIATVLSHIGTWMNDVGAGWLMASLAPSPSMVSLVQAATSLPVFLLAIPAGALADIVDRRKLLLFANSVMLANALAIGLIVYAGMMTPLLLLLFTLVFGIGTALVAPSWQAIVPSLVPRAELSQAVSLNSVGINVSRAIGPALAGYLIVAAGIAWPFLLNALSFLVVILALLWWRPEKVDKPDLPSEHFFSSIATGLRFARSSGPFKATVFRAIAFFLFASAYWALLPLIALKQLSGGPQVYGTLLAFVGIGAVTMALLLPSLNKTFSKEGLVVAGKLSTALILLVFAFTSNVILATAASFVAGAAWLVVLTNLNVSAQTSLPNWVRGRGLAIFISVFFGSMTFGSVVWGQVAEHYSIPVALIAAGGGIVMAYLLTRSFKLHQGESLDLSPSMHWPQPITFNELDHDRGPVMVTIEYKIDDSKKNEFLATVHEMENARRQDGAYAWGIFEDVAEPNKIIEYFIEGSWLVHLRHHERVSENTKEIQLRVNAFHVGESAPLVRHFLSPNMATNTAINKE